jgi:hypothetical protein
MNKTSIYAAGKKLLWGALLFLSVWVPPAAKAAGVTIITHGADGDVTGWVSAMADSIPAYFQNRYPGFSTNFTVYTLVLTTDGKGNYFYQWSRDRGGSPTNTDTGEIIVKLDWSQMAQLGSAYDTSTYKVASIASYVIMQTNAIADLNGHALAEYPIHLVGHSRGGSLMSQISYLLGTNGIWTDQLTTLDPHPLNNDGNNDFPFTTVDAPVHTYSNVLFHDNYWQNQGFLIDPNGEPVAGAYVRNLNSAVITGGYNATSSISPYHSNVHLWYYGTINLATPNTNNDDGEVVTIDSTTRENWWAPYESYGTNAGFLYSLIGGGDRTSLDYPLGLPSDPAVRDGYNQNWDLGGGTNANRTALAANNGTWPNLIKFDITGTNPVTQGNLAGIKFYYQYGGQSNVTVQIYYDRDFNPYNPNRTLVLQGSVANTGPGSVYYYSNLGLSTTNVAPGTYSIYASISDGLHTRYLYTPELLTIVSTNQPPVLDISTLSSTQFRIRVNGVASQNILLQTSTDLQNWQPLATNTLTSSLWIYTNTVPNNFSRQFYRAMLSP